MIKFWVRKFSNHCPKVFDIFWLKLFSTIISFKYFNIKTDKGNIFKILEFIFYKKKIIFLTATTFFVHNAIVSEKIEARNEREGEKRMKAHLMWWKILQKTSICCQPYVCIRRYCAYSLMEWNMTAAAGGGACLGHLANY